MKPEDTETKGCVNETTENDNMQISDDALDQVSGGTDDDPHFRLYNSNDPDDIMTENGWQNPSHIIRMLDQNNPASLMTEDDGDKFVY